MDGRGVSFEGKKCAQIFSNKGYVSRVYPMDSKNKLGDTFIYFVRDLVFLRSLLSIAHFGRYPRSKLGTRRVINKGVLRGIDGRRTGMRTQ